MLHMPLVICQVAAGQSNAPPPSGSCCVEFVLQLCGSYTHCTFKARSYLAPTSTVLTVSSHVMRFLRLGESCCLLVEQAVHSRTSLPECCAWHCSDLCFFKPKPGSSQACCPLLAASWCFKYIKLLHLSTVCSFQPASIVSNYAATVAM